MIHLHIKQFWTRNSPPPPLNEKINYYEIDSELTDPTKFSYIYLGNKINESEKKVLKFIKCKQSNILRIYNEIETMSLIDHPNILKIENYFSYNQYMVIVTPYYPLESLHSFIIKHYSAGIPEKMACIIMYQLLCAVNYLHKNNIWHRDIKPDNVLVVDNNQNNPKVVLADFGFAQKFEKDDLCDEFLGTPEFTAPEIFKMENYSNKVDIWSLGVSLFVMLTAKYPTCSYTKNPKKCQMLIENGLLNYDLLYEMGISHEAIDFIKKLCTVDPISRLKADEALKHPWIVNKSNANDKECDKFFEHGKFQTLALEINDV